MIEKLFILSLIIPVLLWFINLILNEDKTKFFLKINIFVYFILAILATFFFITSTELNTIFFVLDKINIVYYSIIFLLSFLISIYANNYFITEIKYKVIGTW